jgi:hypothetical protein
MSQEIPILLGSEDEYEEFYRAYRCCWSCFSDEMRNRGYDIEVTPEWLEAEGE